MAEQHPSYRNKYTTTQKFMHRGIYDEGVGVFDKIVELAMKTKFDISQYQNYVSGINIRDEYLIVSLRGINGVKKVCFQFTNTLDTKQALDIINDLMCILLTATKQVYPSFAPPERYTVEKYEYTSSDVEHMCSTTFSTFEALDCFTHIIQCYSQCVENAKFSLNSE